MCSAAVALMALSLSLKWTAASLSYSLFSATPNLASTAGMIPVGGNNDAGHSPKNISYGDSPVDRDTVALTAI